MQVKFVYELSNLFHSVRHFLFPNGRDLRFQFRALRQQWMVFRHDLSGRQCCLGIIEKCLCPFYCMLLRGCHRLFRKWKSMNPAMRGCFSTGHKNEAVVPGTEAQRGILRFRPTRLHN
jgi:hypothetical protein